jgi:hypothetical protein
LIISTLICLISSCNQKAEINEAEIYSLINEVIFDDSIVVNNVCWNFNKLSLDKDMLKEFSNEDIEFNEKIKLKFRNLKVKPNKIIHFHYNYKLGDYAKIDSTCNENSVVHLSVPFVSVNRKKILIDIQYDCNCMLGGSGGKYLYEKIKGHWKLNKSFDEWIS